VFGPLGIVFLYCCVVIDTCVYYHGLLQRHCRRQQALFCGRLPLFVCGIIQRPALWHWAQTSVFDALSDSNRLRAASGGAEPSSFGIVSVFVPVPHVFLSLRCCQPCILWQASGCVVCALACCLRG
jgi:hypothetical protein